MEDYSGGVDHRAKRRYIMCLELLLYDGCEMVHKLCWSVIREFIFRQPLPESTDGLPGFITNPTPSVPQHKLGKLSRIQDVVNRWNAASRVASGQYGYLAGEET